MTPTIVQRLIHIILLCFITFLSAHVSAENLTLPKKDWTILVYNFEDPFSRDDDLIEMEKTGSTKNINIVVQSQLYLDNSFGCDVFLMSSDDEAGFNRSDKHHLYLYKDSRGIFYYIENNAEKQYLEDQTIQEALKKESFDQPVEKPNELFDKKLRNAIVEITSKRGHTLKWNFETIARRIYIQKSTQTDKLTSPVIEAMHNIDMGDYRKLEDFLSWGMQKYPAKHYFVIFVGHGSGWYEYAKRDENLRTKHKVASIGKQDGNDISNASIGVAMRDIAQILGHKIDIVGMDACLQGAVEVANELKDSTNLYIASENQTSFPGATFPYARLLKKWESYQNAEPKAVGKMLIDAMSEAYKEDPIFNPNDSDYPDENGPEHRVPSPMSVLDLNQFPSLIQAISHLSKNMQQLNHDAIMKVRAAVAGTRHYIGGMTYGDLLDFINKLKESNITGVRQDYLTEVSDAVNKTVVANTFSLPMKNSNGISIWLQSNSTNDAYKEYQRLSFDKETKWGKAMVFIVDGV